MIKVKFNGTDNFIDVSFFRIDNNVVSLVGDVPASTAGFTTWKANGKRQLGDFSDYTTIYQKLDNGVQFSNNGGVAQEVEAITW